MEYFFPIAEFSVWLPCILRAGHDRIDFPPAFQICYQSRKVLVLYVYLWFEFNLLLSCSLVCGEHTPCISRRVFQFPKCVQRLHTLDELLVNFSDTRKL